MTKKEALKIIIAHQEWRLGGEGEMTTPKLLTAATNVAIKVLSDTTEYVKRSKYRKLNDDYNELMRAYGQLLCDASEFVMKIEELKKEILKIK